MAFIENSAPQKITAKIIKHEIFCGTGFYKRREKNCKEKKKDELSPAIGKNYINKNVSFLLTFYLYMFLLIANRKESEKNCHRKRR